MRDDKAAIRDEIARHPEFLKSHEALFAATKYNRREAVELLLDLGTSPDVESPEGERALHIAAYDDAVDVGELLIARGAEVDPIGRQYDNTPLGGAMHCQSARMIALLARHSRSAWEVGYSGHVDRLRELLAEKPERARGYDGETLLMYLPPDDETKAMEVARLLLEHGADPTIKDPQGKTAADRAERNAMYRVAAFLREAEETTVGGLLAGLPQQLLNLGFIRFLVNDPKMRIGNPSPAIDEDSDRQIRDFVLRRHIRIHCHNGYRTGCLARKGFTASPPLVIHRDADRAQTLRRVSGLVSLEPWHLELASRTPRRPEVQQDHTAAKIRQPDGRPVGILEKEIRRWLTFVSRHQARTILTGRVRRDQNNRDRRCESDLTQCHHVTPLR